MSEQTAIEKAIARVRGAIKANDGNTDFGKTGEKDRYFQGVFRGRIEGLGIALAWLENIKENMPLPEPPLEDEKQSNKKPEKPYCDVCKDQGYFRGIENSCPYCNPGGEFRKA